MGARRHWEAPVYSHYRHPWPIGREQIWALPISDAEVQSDSTRLLGARYNRYKAEVRTKAAQPLAHALNDTLFMSTRSAVTRLRRIIAWRVNIVARRGELPVGVEPGAGAERRRNPLVGGQQLGPVYRV